MKLAQILCGPMQAKLKLNTYMHMYICSLRINSLGGKDVK
jgi:hypothetical protein